MKLHRTQNRRGQGTAPWHPILPATRPNDQGTGRECIPAFRFHPGTNVELQTLSQGSGFGLIDLRLDELVTDVDSARDMVELLRRSVGRAHRYSPAFPVDWADRLGLTS